MAAIGSLTVDAMRGVLFPPGQSVEEITRPGVDGVVARQLGRRAMGASLTTWLGIQKANQASALASHKNLEGTIVTVIDGRGITTTNVLVLSCELRVEDAALAVGFAETSTTAIITATWQVRYQG